jgi:hypothetical protein
MRFMSRKTAKEIIDDYPEIGTAEFAGSGTQDLVECGGAVSFFRAHYLSSGLI